MEKKQINDIKGKGRLIRFNINNNSKIYLKNDELLKFSTEIKNVDSFEKIIGKINDSEFFVQIKYLLYEKEKLKGYSMHFYKDAKNLKQLFNKPLALKKNDCLNIQKVFGFMTENNLHYNDVYRKNFMITSSGQLLVADLESLSDSKTNELAVLNQRMAFVLSLSYLYNLEVNEILALIKNQSTFLINDNELLFDYFYNLNENNDVQKLLNLISTDDIIANRRELKKNSKILSKNEYFRKYYY